MNANKWISKSCKFAQGQGLPPVQPAVPQPAPQPDMGKKIVESMGILINEVIQPDVDIKHYTLDRGSRGDFHTEPSGPGLDDLDASMSLKGKNAINMNEEATELGLPDAASAVAAYQKHLPVRIEVRSSISFDHFDVSVSGTVTITGLGPMNANGICVFSYSPEPIPVSNWTYD